MIIDTIQEWFKEVLIDGIISNLSGTFDTVNTKVAEIAGEVGMTPSGWNGGIFNMIRSLSETVIVPIAGIILTFVMCYELIQLIVEKNNLHDFDTWLFWKWIFKTFCAVLIVTNTYTAITGQTQYAEVYPTLTEKADVEQFETWLDEWCSRNTGSHWLSYLQSDAELAESFAQIE